jgi:putative transposase
MVRQQGQRLRQDVYELIQTNQAELPVHAMCQRLGVSRSGVYEWRRRRRGWVVTTQRDKTHKVSPDLMNRQFTATGLNQLSVADMTYVLNMALITRKPQSVIHHTDQGSQYTSMGFGRRCEQMGVKPSMGTVGDAYDNAMAESFFSSPEC